MHVCVFVYSGAHIYIVWTQPFISDVINHSTN